MKNLVLAVLLTLVLTACGSSVPTMTPTSVPPTALPAQPTQAPASATALPPQSTQAPASATALPAEMPAQDGATLLETRCSTCHSAAKATQARQTRAQWDQTVIDMVNEGAQLTEAEKTVLLDYLAKTYGP